MNGLVTTRLLQQVSLTRRGVVIPQPLVSEKTIGEEDPLSPTDFPAVQQSPVTLFAPRGRVTALLQRTLRASGPNGGDGDGGDSNDSLPTLRVVRTFFEPQQQISPDVQLFDPLLLATIYHRLRRVLTDLVVVRGEALIKQSGLEDRLRKLTQHDPQERFVELVSLARGRAIDGMPFQRKIEGLPVVHISNPGPGKNSFAQYRFYQTEGPPIVVVWSDEERHASLFEGRRGAAIGRKLARVELTELNTLLEMVWNSLGSPKQMERLGYLEGHLLKMEVLNLYHPGRFRPEFFDQLWRFVYLVRAMGSMPTLDGSPPSPVMKTFQSLRAEIEGALPSP